MVIYYVLLYTGLLGNSFFQAPLFYISVICWGKYSDNVKPNPLMVTGLKKQG